MDKTSLVSRQVQTMVHLPPVLTSPPMMESTHPVVQATKGAIRAKTSPKNLNQLLSTTRWEIPGTAVHLIEPRTMGRPGRAIPRNCRRLQSRVATRAPLPIISIIIRISNTLALTTGSTQVRLSSINLQNVSESKFYLSSLL